MRCIVKKTGIFILIALTALSFSGCGNHAGLDQKYDVFETTAEYGIGAGETAEKLSFYASDLCVGGNEDILNEAVTDRISEAAGLFGLQERAVLYAKNIHGTMYPASTTKILTAYVALKYGDLNATATVSGDALKLEEGSTTCGVSEGDTLTLEQLLYGLMLCSGNDAANVIAELISGSTEEFARLMNQEAHALGATNSSFVNPHGLHSDQHYTTVYDMYLIFQAAMKNDTFRQIISTTTYKTEFTNRNGRMVEKLWKNTNRYLNNEADIPDGITVVGGKTGTTGAAGYCLVLYSENSEGNGYVSIVFKGDSRDNLYYQMSELLKIISN